MGENAATADRAFEIADQSMVELLIAHCALGAPGGILGKLGLTDEACSEVKLLSEASGAIREAMEWLMARGMATLGKDDGGEFAQLVMAKVCDVVVSEDRRRVWVNAPDGSCIGRFNGRGMVDVHRTVQEQMDGAGECLDCSHAGEPVEQWRRFRESMMRNYGIEIEESLVTLDGQGAAGAWMKARVGDFIRVDGVARKVVGVSNEADRTVAAYLFEDGSGVLNSEVKQEDVLLESEVGG